MAMMPDPSPPSAEENRQASGQSLIRPAFSQEYQDFIEVAQAVLGSQAALDVETPFLMMDLDKVTERFTILRETLPSAAVFYAVKANSNRTLLEHLRDLGSGFDVSSARELYDVAIGLGVSSERIVYTHPLKDERALNLIKEVQPRTIVIDSRDGLLQLLAHGIPGNGYHPVLLVRVQAINSNLNKFGVPWLIADPSRPREVDAMRVDNSEVCDIFCAAASVPAEQRFSKLGVAFHVGTQAVSATKYTRMLGICRQALIDELSRRGVELGVIDIGGGFPDTPTAERVGRSQRDMLAKIERHLRDPKYVPPGTEIFVEPGRFLTADAGAIVSKFIKRTTMHGYQLPMHKQREWGIELSEAGRNSTVLSLTLDDSLFKNLAGQAHDGKEWQILPFHVGPHSSPLRGEPVRALVFGGTCDGYDELRTLQKEKGYWLPEDITVGTLALVPCSGAYTNATASEFNGFPRSDVVLFSRRDTGVHCVFDRAPHIEAARVDLRESSLPLGFRGSRS